MVRTLYLYAVRGELGPEYLNLIFHLIATAKSGGGTALFFHEACSKFAHDLAKKAGCTSVKQMLSKAVILS